MKLIYWPSSEAFSNMLMLTTVRTLQICETSLTAMYTVKRIQTMAALEGDLTQRAFEDDI